MIQDIEQAYCLKRHFNVQVQRGRSQDNKAQNFIVCGLGALEAVSGGMSRSLSSQIQVAVVRGIIIHGSVIDAVLPIALCLTDARTLKTGARFRTVTRERSHEHT